MQKYQTNEEKKAYLKSYFQLKLYTKNIETLLTELSSEQVNYSFLLNSTEYSAKNKLLIKALENLLMKRIQFLENIPYKIDLLHSDKEKNILILKYIHGYTWEEISELTNYSLRQLYNIHTCAISHLEI